MSRGHRAHSASRPSERPCFRCDLAVLSSGPCAGRKTDNVVLLLRCFRVFYGSGAAGPQRRLTDVEKWALCLAARPQGAGETEMLCRTETSHSLSLMHLISSSRRGYFGLRGRPEHPGTPVWGEIGL